MTGRTAQSDAGQAVFAIREIVGGTSEEVLAAVLVVGYGSDGGFSFWLWRLISLRIGRQDFTSLSAYGRFGHATFDPYLFRVLSAPEAHLRAGSGSPGGPVVNHGEWSKRRTKPCHCGRLRF